VNFTRQPPFTPNKISGTHFCQRLYRPQGHSVNFKIIVQSTSRSPKWSFPHLAFRLKLYTHFSSLLPHIGLDYGNFGAILLGWRISAFLSSVLSLINFHETQFDVTSVLHRDDSYSNERHSKISLLGLLLNSPATDSHIVTVSTFSPLLFFVTYIVFSLPLFIFFLKDYVPVFLSTSSIDFSMPNDSQ
jgi:hypothetical protein